MRRMLPAPVLPVITFLLLTATMLSCADTKDNKQTAINIAYPLPLPDSTAITFLPGIASKDSFDFNAAFSPDGQSYYFSRSGNNRTSIYVTHHDGTSWTEPVPAPFSLTRHSDADPAFAPDGKLYFISDRPKNAADTIPDFDIWFVIPDTSGSWSAPQNLAAINTDSNEFYMSFTTKGDIYFGSSRQGGYGEEDIYVSRLTNGQYMTPENLGTAINSSKAEFDPFITPKEDLLFFASSNRADGLGGADLYSAKTDNNKQWQQAVHLGENINTPTRDFCPYFSPDSRYFFFSSNRDIKWIGAKHVNK